MHSCGVIQSFPGVNSDCVNILMAGKIKQNLPNLSNRVAAGSYCIQKDSKIFISLLAFRWMNYSKNILPELWETYVRETDYAVRE